MTDYGLTTNGFVLKRGDEILSEIKARLATTFPNIDLSDDSVVMQLTGVQAYPYSSLWELANAVYNAFYPATAEGQSLDNLCELNAITRLKASASTAVLAIGGIGGTQITPYFRAGVINKQNVIFQSIETVTISNDNTNKMILTVNTVLNNTDYIITINSHTAQITSGAAATAIAIAASMVTEINNLSDLLGVQASLPSPQDGTFTIISNDTDFAFKAVPNSYFTITSFWTPVNTTCTQIGAVSANTGEISIIITPVAGLNSITNLKDAEEGREIETDSQLRIRRYNSIRAVGAATVEAIRIRLLEVLNVKQALVYENDTMVVDIAGRPAKSIECLVSGGATADIAEEIWLVKPAGILTYGNISYTITDSMGFTHVINFSRPITVYIWIRITLTVDNNVFPTNGSDLITTNILEMSTGFEIGDDILIQKFFCPIYAVDGVISAVVELARTLTLTPPGVYVQTNLAIAQSEASNFDSSRINIIIP